MPAGWIATDTGVDPNGIDEPAGSWQFAANGTTGPFAVGVLVNTQGPAGKMAIPTRLANRGPSGCSSTTPSGARTAGTTATRWDGPAWDRSR